LKGELTIVISKIYNKTDIELTDVNIIHQANEYLKKYSLKDVVELISKKEKISKKKVYEICLKIRKNENN
jgi:16S rRNA (cytidine1402-2'-O)-methyltransferase